MGKRLNYERLRHRGKATEAAFRPKTAKKSYWDRLADGEILSPLEQLGLAADQLQKRRKGQRR